MGEHAEIALWAEMNDMDIEDAYFEYSEPGMTPTDVKFDMEIFLSGLNLMKDEDSPPTTAEVLTMMFPELDQDETDVFVKVAEQIAATKVEEDEDE